MYCSLIWRRKHKQVFDLCTHKQNIYRAQLYLVVSFSIVSYMATNSRRNMAFQSSRMEWLAKIVTLYCTWSRHRQTGKVSLLPFQWISVLGERINRYCKLSPLVHPDYVFLESQPPPSAVGIKECWMQVSYWKHCLSAGELIQIKHTTYYRLSDYS